MRRVFGFVAAVIYCVSVLFAGNPSQAQTNDAYQVGIIDFFGGQGMDIARLRSKVPVRIGQTIDVEHMDGLKSGIDAAVLAATGKPDTDVAFICCDQPGKMQLYIGLQGSSYKVSSYAAAPTGDVMLPDDGVVLYRKDMDANEHAVQSGHPQEDDSNGYALSSDPAMHAVELMMRTYALKHTEAIEEVLRKSKDAEQRTAAATLLGYSERSQEQVKDLALAAGDANSEVRNNAVRALRVLAVAQPLVGLDIKPFVAMLYSGSWTDRNKASFLLDRLTSRRDPMLLDALRQQAMGPLIDGAQWQSAGHAYPFLMILGRIEGLDETQLKSMVNSGTKQEIINAAMKQ